MNRTVVVGSLNVDSVIRVDRHPSTGETVLGRDRRRGWGGKGANQAVAAAAAGAQVTFVGCVGDDPDGRAYVEHLSGLGIDVGHIIVTPDAPTGLATVAVDARGDNMIVVEPGANARFDEGALDVIDTMNAGDVLLAQLEIPLDVVTAALRRARSRGARVVLNLAPYARLPEDVLALADPAVVNEHERLLLAADGPLPRSLLVTRGSRGATWGRLTSLPLSSPKVVDTTGAGDVFCGTLAALLADGASDATALNAAVAAATTSVGALGAQSPG
jgi:ribokinase